MTAFLVSFATFAAILVVSLAAAARRRNVLDLRDGIGPHRGFDRRNP